MPEHANGGTALDRPSSLLARAGAWAADRLVGPDPSPGEVATTFATALVGTALTVGAALATGLPALAAVVIGIVAFDFFGGAVAAATPSAKRRYHAPGQTRGRHLAFVALHVQPFLLALFVPDLTWWSAAAVYLLTLAGATVTSVAPPELRRPVAFAATVAGTAAVLLFLPLPSALTWLAPVLLVKVLLGHMLPEAAHKTGEEATHGTEAGRPGGTA